MPSRPPSPIDRPDSCTTLVHARQQLRHRIRELACLPEHQLTNAFRAFVITVDIALRSEELAMEALALPYLRERRRQNAAIMDALYGAAPAIEAGDATLCRDTLARLRDLLDVHRIAADLAVAGATATDQARPFPFACFTDKP